MKYIFCRNITENKEAEPDSIDALITRSVDEQQQSALEDAAERALNVEANSNLKPGFKILKAIAAFFTVIPLCAYLRNIGELGLAQMYANAPVIAYIFAVAAVLWFVLWLIEKRRKKQVSDSGEDVRVEKSIEALVRRSHEQLGVPYDTVNVDVLSCSYKLKNGAYKPKDGFSEYDNTDYCVFVENGALCVVDAFHRCELPLEGARLKSVKKNSTMSGWNKEEKFNKGQFKPYKMNANNYGAVIIHAHGELTVNCMGEEYTLLVPPYEVPVLERLTGLRVENA